MSAYQKGLCSICCLGYCHAQFLQKCIHSVWNGDYRDIELIVLDDGSLDNSVELLNKLVEQSPFPMTIITQKNTGNISKNLNKVFQKARGEYVTFLSLDDMLYKYTIAKKIRLMDDDPSLAFIADSTISIIDDKDNIVEFHKNSNICKEKLLTIDDLLEMEYRIFGSFYMQGVIFRSEMVKKIGGFDEDMLGDDIIFRTKLFLYMKQNRRYTFKFDEDPACYYRMHDGNVHKSIERQIGIVTEYLQRYWPERDNPETLITWMRHVIRTQPFQEFIKVFSMNLRAASLLLDNTIQSEMIDAVFEEYNKKPIQRKWTDCFYKKIRHRNKRRDIILFSFFKISYRHKE